MLLLLWAAITNYSPSCEAEGLKFVRAVYKSSAPRRLLYRPAELLYRPAELLRKSKWPKASLRGAAVLLALAKQLSPKGR